VTDTPRIESFAHFAMVVSDVENSQRWYTDVLGATVPQRGSGLPPCIQLAGTVIDLFQSGGVTPAGIPLTPPAPGSIGQHHAFNIALDAYDAWVAHFEALGQKHRRAAHGEALSIYVDDPDGYHIELTVEFADMTLGRQEMAKRGLTPMPMSSSA
jgi:catechol 2,3-dioxygenase-like lactoylglutathione lyase family enzyme